MTRNLLTTIATLSTTKKAVGALATAITGLTLAAGPAVAAGHPTPTAHTATPATAAVAVHAATKADPAPVAGLDQTQMNNAQHIVDAAKKMGLDDHAKIIAIATAMQESKLYNLASTAIPESYHYHHEGEGSDYDSVGLFQQRPNWGDTKDLMNPETSAHKFLQALKQVPGWDTMPVTDAAQAVQVSAYPDAYAPHEGPATQVVHALTK
jgi:hypothetical protein